MELWVSLSGFSILNFKWKEKVKKVIWLFECDDTDGPFTSWKNWDFIWNMYSRLFHQISHFLECSSNLFHHIHDMNPEPLQSPQTPSSLYMPDFHWVISKWCWSFFHHWYDEVDKTLENPGLLYLQVSFTIFMGRSLFHILWWISPHTATRAMTREWSTWGSTTKSNTSSPSTTPEDVCFCFTSAMTPPSLFTILNVDLPAKPCIL